VNKKRINIPRITPIDPKFEVVQFPEHDDHAIPMQVIARRAYKPSVESSESAYIRSVHVYEYANKHIGYIALRLKASHSPTRGLHEALQESSIHVVDVTAKRTKVVGEGIAERRRDDFTGSKSEAVVTMNEDSEDRADKGYNIRRLALIGAATVRLLEGAIATSGDISDKPNDLEAWKAMADKGLVEQYEVEIANGVTQVQYRFINEFNQK
jgi:hypothetical protein